MRHPWGILFDLFGARLVYGVKFIGKKRDLGQRSNEYLNFAKRVFMIVRFSLYHRQHSGYDVIFFRGKGLIL